MKTTRTRSILSVAIALTLMIMMTTALSRHVAEVQYAAMACQQSAPVLPSAAYSDLLNGMAAVGGR